MSPSDPFGWKTVTAEEQLLEGRPCGECAWQDQGMARRPVGRIGERDRKGLSDEVREVPLMLGLFSGEGRSHGGGHQQ